MSTMATTATTATTATMAIKDTFSTVCAPASTQSVENGSSVQFPLTNDCICICECSKRIGYDTLAPKLLVGGLRRISVGNPQANFPQIGCKHFATCPLSGLKCN